MHCLCGRQKDWGDDGRKRPRTPKEQCAVPAAGVVPMLSFESDPTPTPPAAASVELVMQPALGRPAATGVDILGAGTWRERALAEIATAARVVLFTYEYNAMDFQTTLLQRLRSRKQCPFEVVLAVDNEKFKKSRSLLLQLVEKGADVYRCEGEKDTARYGPGAYSGSAHMKAVVIDGRIAYCGSANLTEASKKNLEMMIRLVGAPVRDISAMLQDTLLRPTTTRVIVY